MYSQCSFLYENTVLPWLIIFYSRHNDVIKVMHADACLKSISLFQTNTCDSSTKVHLLYSLCLPCPVLLWLFRCPRKEYYPGMVHACLEHCPSFLSDDDNSEEGLTTIHSGRHEYAFSLELPQTWVSFFPLATFIHHQLQKVKTRH